MVIDFPLKTSKTRWCRWGAKWMVRPGSDDPHRCQRKFITSADKGKLAKSNCNVYTVERKKLTVRFIGIRKFC